MPVQGAQARRGGFLAVLVLIVAGSAFLGLVPQAQAQAASDSGSCDFYRQQEVVQIIAVVNAGTNRVWGNNPGCGVARSATQALAMATVYNGPVLATTAGLTAGLVWDSTFQPAVGCTITLNGQSSSTAAGAMESEAYFTVQMTSTECHGFVKFSVNVLSSAVLVYQWRSVVPYNIRVEQPNYSFMCAATGITANAYAPGSNTCTTPQVDNDNRLCAASTLGSSCTTPALTTDNLNRLCAASALGASCVAPTLNLAGTLNVAQSGSWSIDTQDRLCAASSLGAACTAPTVNLGGTVSVAQSGSWQVDNENRLCASSAFGTACTTPTVNGGTVTVTPSGVQHLVMDSWPTLNAAVSGSITATLSGTVTLAGGVTVSGTLDQLTRLCAASATGSPCVTPVVLECSTAALAADAKACSGGAGSMANVNTTIGSASFPDKLHLCGPQLVSGDCTPVQNQGTVSFPDVGGRHGVDWWMEAIFWFAVLLGAMYAGWWVVVGFAIPGFLHFLAPSLPFPMEVALPLLFLGLLLEWVAQRMKLRKEGNNPQGEPA